MFSNVVPKFTIDLTLPEKDRWTEVLRAMKQPAMGVVREAGHEFRHVPWGIRQAFARLYNRKGGLYVDEMKSISKALGIALGTTTVLNCAYELSHLYMPKLFGCTAGVRFVEGKGMVHIRNLDWPLPAMGDATCIFDFRQKNRNFLAVGVPGHVGVLSGMLPGAYSITINWAAPNGWPNFQYGPMFLLRQVFEHCSTYQSAVRALTDIPLSTSVFFTVCGVNKGEGCVIERVKSRAEVRSLDGGVVVKGNHFEAADFTRHNSMINQLENVEFLAESWVRAEVLTKALAELPSGADLFAPLDLKPVLNKETVQQMVFCPATGEVAVKRFMAQDLRS